MPGHLVPQGTDIAEHSAPLGWPRSARLLRVLAPALLAISLGAPTPARAASALSDGSVTPTSGTTETTFTFSVHHVSPDTPVRPAQAVWADVGGVIVTLTKLSGSAHDGTWEGTATLPAGTWQVTFHATTSSDPQPDPLPGPIVTVTEPPPPTPSPTPVPTAEPTPQPTTPPMPVPPAPSPSPPANPPPRPQPAPQPTPPPTDDEDATPTQPATASPTPSDSGSARPGAPVPTPTGTAYEGNDRAGTLGLTGAAANDAAASSGSTLAPFLIIGGTMTLAGAAILARQWFVSRRFRRH